MKATLPITRCLVGGSNGRSDADKEEATALALNQLLELAQVGKRLSFALVCNSCARQACFVACNKTLSSRLRARKPQRHNRQCQLFIERGTIVVLRRGNLREG